jgi:Serine hydrolase (FSH1)
MLVSEKKIFHVLFQSLIVVILVVGNLPSAYSMTPSSSISTTTTSSSTTTTSTIMRRPRILCLHGRCQSGMIFSNKIGGARRKLEKVYELDFIDAPYPAARVAKEVASPMAATNDSGCEGEGDSPTKNVVGGLGWWMRNEHDGSHDVQQIHETFDYIQKYVQQKQKQQQQQQQQNDDPPFYYYDAIIGFSQGGLLATALALSGDLPVQLPGIQAIVTASSPYVPQVIHIAQERAHRNDKRRYREEGGDDSSYSSGSCWQKGFAIPKLHLAGATDTMIPVDMVEQLCQEGGNGELLVHEKGHLFPTNAVHVNAILDFLKRHVT